MIHRRKFLERSAVLGAGSLLFPAVLLQSCRKDGIPDPVTQTPPLLGAASIDWAEWAKGALIAGLEMIPEAGEILGPLVDVFWPPTKDDNIWDEVREEVLAAINQAIAENVYQTVLDDLQGLYDSITLYREALTNGTTFEIMIFWTDVRLLCVNARPHFQAATYETRLLPLYVQYANMYMALLRDGILNGHEWGMTDLDRQSLTTHLKTFIAEATDWVNQWFGVGRVSIARSIPENDQNIEPFTSLNRFDRQMTLMALDFRDMWPYFDTTTNPGGMTVPLTREIYSDPYGTAGSNNGGFSIPAVPTQFPTQIDFWFGDEMTAFQVTYPQGGGPGGVTQTARFGAPSGGTHSTLNLTADNPLIGATITAGDVVNTIQFSYHGGEISPQYGNNQATTGHYLSGPFKFEAISSLYTGPLYSQLFNAPYYIVIGYKYYQSPKATLEALRSIYVTSPVERTAADFANAFPKFAIPADFITGELKAARKAHWDALHARAAAIGG